MQAITCERCHGDGAAHVRRPSSKNIVNPAALSGAARDSVCEQCHLEGETRILNPGKSLDDYRPGEPLEQTLVTYLFRRAEAEKRAVWRMETAESKCARGSNGKLWCRSCHRPHEPASQIGTAHCADQLKSVSPAMPDCLRQRIQRVARMHRIPDMQAGPPKQHRSRGSDRSSDSASRRGEQLH